MRNSPLNDVVRYHELFEIDFITNFHGKRVSFWNRFCCNSSLGSKPSCSNLPGDSILRQVRTRAPLVSKSFLPDFNLWQFFHWGSALGDCFPST